MRKGKVEGRWTDTRDRFRVDDGESCFRGTGIKINSRIAGFLFCLVSEQFLESEASVFVGLPSSRRYRFHWSRSREWREEWRDNYQLSRILPIRGTLIPSFSITFLSKYTWIEKVYLLKQVPSPSSFLFCVISRSNSRFIDHSFVICLCKDICSFNYFHFLEMDLNFLREEEEEEDCS